MYIKRILTIHEQYLNYGFRALISIMPPIIFIMLVNVKNWCNGYVSRYYYSKKYQLFYVEEDDEYKIYFSEKVRGYDMYSKGIVVRGKRMGEVYHLNEIEFETGDVVIDCGANYGDFFLYFKINKFDIRYYGYEPSLSEYICLSKNIEKHNCFNLGLWKETGVLDFYESSKNADSSFIEPKEFHKRIKACTSRLDEFEYEKIKLLKLEAEGAEPEVLIGCSNLLHKIEYISADLGPERGINNEYTFESVTNFLFKNNFEIEKVSFDRVAVLFKNKAFK